MDRGRRSLVFGAAAATTIGFRAEAADAPVIAAAADLQGPLPEIAAAFAKQTGQEVRVSFGSSGSFALQIPQGAPFQVFLSADEAYVQRLHAAGHTLGAGALYAIGRIGMFTAKASPVRCSGDLADVAPAIRDGRLTRFAIADPKHAPYGVAAKQALTKVGVWRQIEPRLVLGQNAAQATTFAVSGAAQAGIIPYSLALRPEARAAGVFALIPDRMHAPLRQRAVVLKGATPTAKAFYDYLQTPSARAVFKKYGFVLPTEAP